MLGSRTAVIGVMAAVLAVSGVTGAPAQAEPGVSSVRTQKPAGMEREQELLEQARKRTHSAAARTKAYIDYGLASNSAAQALAKRLGNTVDLAAAEAQSADRETDLESVAFHDAVASSHALLAADMFSYDSGGPEIQRTAKAAHETAKTATAAAGEDDRDAILAAANAATEAENAAVAAIRAATGKPDVKKIDIID
ncbi:hypothetical protein [Nocardia brasiliensis]|uniref:hypothetical protein n=1 Tax=Nocardia brasiliensis TaxID=37326 RepID=UPI001892FB58|nr:hypothetical protein [Nocardia brasiliensis]MBF6128773.1 hypothetical protein [Nocardia brasiliensis]